MKAWEDTVMSQDDFDEWCGTHQVTGCGGDKNMCEDKCRPLAQAEISFKAGYIEGYQDKLRGYINKHPVPPFVGGKPN